MRCEKGLERVRQKAYSHCSIWDRAYIGANFHFVELAIHLFEFFSLATYSDCIYWNKFTTNSQKHPKKNLIYIDIIHNIREELNNKY